STGRAVDANKALQSVNPADVTAPGPINELLVQVTDAFPNYQARWLATGDDGNSGKVAAYELRYSETSLNDTNFDLGIPLPGPVPMDPGFTQFIEFKIPWRHSSGFVGVRAVDDVGNKGPISQVPISVSVDVGDPYIMTESAAAPVSTGGQALSLIGDDE